MKILIVTHRALPHGDASSAVVENLAHALMEQGCESKVLGLTGYPEDRNILEWKGISVTNVYALIGRSKEQILCGLRLYAPLDLCALLLRSFSKAIEHAWPVYRKQTVIPLYLPVYRKAIQREMQTGQYDLCLVTLAPYEAVFAVRQMPEMKGRFAVYQLDAYWNRADLPVEFKEERLTAERQMIAESLFVLTTPQIIDSYRSKAPELVDKVIPAEFPMVKEQLWQERLPVRQNEKPHCAFLGTLYSGIRPPEKVVRLISELSSDTIFDFYGSGQDLIEKSPDYSIAKERICLHGPVSPDQAAEARRCSDVLVNIDNTSVTQVPSKIFEYMSTGKPILNFYFNSESPTLAYFSKYPLCCSVNLNADVAQAARTVDAFLKETFGRQILFAEIKQIFLKNTPEYVAEQCLAAYEEAVKRRAK